MGTHSSPTGRASALISRRCALQSGSLIAAGAAAPPAFFAFGRAPLASGASDSQGTNVAVVLSPGATVIDFAGPWEVFQDAYSSGAQQPPGGFNLYTVAKSREARTASAGLAILPNYAFKDAPVPAIVVVPAQKGGPELEEYIRSVHIKGEITMSVCTGAFQLARAGLLDGLTATTHHDFCDKLEEEFPRVHVVRRTRFIDHGTIATAAGLTAGIDLALHVVERRMGTATANQTAAYMEYEKRT